MDWPSAAIVWKNRSLLATPAAVPDPSWPPNEVSPSGGQLMGRVRVLELVLAKNCEPATSTTADSVGGITEADRSTKRTATSHTRGADLPPVLSQDNTRVSGCDGRLATLHHPLSPERSEWASTATYRHTRHLATSVRTTVAPHTHNTHGPIAASTSHHTYPLAMCRQGQQRYSTGILASSCSGM